MVWDRAVPSAEKTTVHVRVLEALTFKSGEPQGVCDRTDAGKEVQIISQIGLASHEHSALAKPAANPDRKRVLQVLFKSPGNFLGCEAPPNF